MAAEATKGRQTSCRLHTILSYKDLLWGNLVVVIQKGGESRDLCGKPSFFYFFLTGNLISLITIHVTPLEEEENCANGALR